MLPRVELPGVQQRIVRKKHRSFGVSLQYFELVSGYIAEGVLGQDKPFLCKAVQGENLRHLSEDRFTGAPDLLVEVISADSVRRDRVEKFLEYEREGVREYWLVDSRLAHYGVEAFSLQGTTYVPIEVDGEGWLPSRVLPGFRLKPAWFTGETLPDSLTALIEMLSPELRAELRQRLGGE